MVATKAPSPAAKVNKGRTSAGPWRKKNTRTKSPLSPTDLLVPPQCPLLAEPTFSQQAKPKCWLQSPLPVSRGKRGMSLELRGIKLITGIYLWVYSINRLTSLSCFFPVLWIISTFSGLPYPLQPLPVYLWPLFILGSFLNGDSLKNKAMKSLKSPWLWAWACQLIDFF